MIQKQFHRLALSSGLLYIISGHKWDTNASMFIILSQQQVPTLDVYPSSWYHQLSAALSGILSFALSHLACMRIVSHECVGCCRDIWGYVSKFYLLIHSSGIEEEEEGAHERWVKDPTYTSEWHGCSVICFPLCQKVCSSLINDKTRSLEMSFSTMPDLRSVRHGCIWWETNCFKE